MRLQAADDEADDIAATDGCMHPVVVVPDGLARRPTSTSTTRRASRTWRCGLLKWLRASPDLGQRLSRSSTSSTRQEDERVGALLRHIDGERWRNWPAWSGRPPHARAGRTGTTCAMIDYPWRARAARHRPRRRRDGRRPAADRPAQAGGPHADARTGTGCSASSRTSDAWHLYLDVVTPMFNEQSVTAVAHKIVDRAHEVSCDAIDRAARRAGRSPCRTGSRPGSYPR